MKGLRLAAFAGACFLAMPFIATAHARHGVETLYRHAGLRFPSWVRAAAQAAALRAAGHGLLSGDLSLVRMAAELSRPLERRRLRPVLDQDADRPDMELRVMWRDYRHMSILRLPLFRLLAINLAIGIGMAALMFVGLLALIPSLHTLILNDRAGLVAPALLLFGLVVTFGSVAMGTAIMTLGRKPPKDDNKGGKLQAIPLRARG